jgi:primase-polymerase (primpol)-like protein
MDYSQIKSAMSTVSRKKDGNLANKSLVDVVQKKHVVSSAHLDTVFCAVPRSLLTL